MSARKTFEASCHGRRKNIYLFFHFFLFSYRQNNLAGLFLAANFRVEQRAPSIRRRKLIICLFEYFVVKRSSPWFCAKNNLTSLSNKSSCIFLMIMKTWSKLNNSSKEGKKGEEREQLGTPFIWIRQRNLKQKKKKTKTSYVITL